VSRVLITGGTGTLGAAIARRLLANPAYEVRVSDRRAAPQWMREGCELHTGDLRVPREARAATNGCTHAIHLAALAGGDPDLPWRGRPYTLMDARNAVDSAVIAAAVAHELERFVYVSSAAVFERASELPTTEAHLMDCPAPVSADGLSMLAGERRCRAAHEEHGLVYTICRPFDPYGPGTALALCGSGELAAGDSALALCGPDELAALGTDELRRTPTHVDDIADGVIAAMTSPAAVNEDFNIAAARADRGR
jgi:nucleoside-diphosphate-sugar epimerase